MDSKELLQQQLNTKRKKKGVKPDLQAGIAYNAELQRIVRGIQKDIRTSIMPIVKSAAPEYQRDSEIVTVDSWVDVLTDAIQLLKNRWSSARFQSLAKEVATKFVLTSGNTNKKRYQNDFGVNVYGDSQTLTDNIRLSIAANVSLIESIPDQYLTQVESIVMSNVRAGGRPATIAKSLQKQFGVTERRAKMIARDQTAKLTGDLNRLRQTSAGFPFFRWMDSDDQRVRDRHEAIANKVTAYGKGIYRWDNPPLSSDGVPIIPGQDYQCRCIAVGVSQEEVDANIKAGRVVKGVLR